ncbi:MAG: outer membrane protein assembly factor BamD [Gemmatimonadaceae bacterium]|nr:outer membrane protein assembly factor BamD [Gemmatimonadaceae bacterium]
MTARGLTDRARSHLWWLVFAVAACGGGGWKLRSYPTPDALYAASLLEFQRKHWDNAVEGFEKVTIDLGARDPLLPGAYLYLARAYVRRGEYLVAANTFSRISESFPDDTLADDALYEQGLAYAKMWGKPELDQQYGLLAQATLRTLVSAYPDSPLKEQATAELSRLDEWLASKDLEIGLHYKRRGAPDSAIIYLRDVLNLYPTTNAARRAGIALVDVYRTIKYLDDATELCDKLRKGWPTDAGVTAACPAVLPTVGAKPPPTPPGA